MLKVTERIDDIEDLLYMGVTATTDGLQNLGNGNPFSDYTNQSGFWNVQLESLNNIGFVAPTRAELRLSQLGAGGGAPPGSQRTDIVSSALCSVSEAIKVSVGQRGWRTEDPL